MVQYFRNDELRWSYSCLPLDTIPALSDNEHFTIATRLLRHKQELASIIFAEGAHKVHTIDSEGQCKNKSIPFTALQNYTLLQHTIFWKSQCLSSFHHLLVMWSWTFSVFQFLIL